AWFGGAAGAGVYCRGDHAGARQPDLRHFISYSADQWADRSRLIAVATLFCDRAADQRHSRILHHTDFRRRRDQLDRAGVWHCRGDGVYHRRDRDGDCRIQSRQPADDFQLLSLRRRLCRGPLFPGPDSVFQDFDSQSEHQYLRAFENELVYRPPAFPGAADDFPRQGLHSACPGGPAQEFAELADRFAAFQPRRLLYRLHVLPELRADFAFNGVPPPPRAVEHFASHLDLPETPYRAW